MAGGCNKKKSLRSGRNKKLGRDSQKRITTQKHKIRILQRHLKTHEGDQSAVVALKRWKENPPNKK